LLVVRPGGAASELFWHRLFGTLPCGHAAPARAKRRIAARLDSRALDADSRQSSICAYLAAILLGGLVSNALFGWWWADPLAALAMSPIIAKEGFEALKGDGCGCAG
jgi:divalent metal cation (Fe/Co/Zn/Cd) transporter